MADWAMQLIAIVLLAIGTIFMVLGAVGVVRMPDVYLRIQAASKTSSLGILCVFLAVAFHFGDLAAITRALAVIAFAVVTVPVAAHALARAAYRVRTPMWPHTERDDLRADEHRTSAAVESSDPSRDQPAE